MLFIERLCSGRIRVTGPGPRNKLDARTFSSRIKDSEKQDKAEEDNKRGEEGYYRRWGQTRSAEACILSIDHPAIGEVTWPQLAVCSLHGETVNLVKKVSKGVPSAGNETCATLG